MRSATLAVLFTTGSALQAREWTDSTGTYKVTAEFVTLRGNQVVLEKSSGEIISIPITRLSPLDQAYVRGQSAPKIEMPLEVTRSTISRADGPPAGTIHGVAEARDLAGRTEAILQRACHRCHGEDGTSEGGFNFVTNLEKLATTYAKPTSPSQLVDRISARDDSVMPPVGEDPRLSLEDIEVIKSWIAAGSPTIPRSETRSFVTNEAVVESIHSHVSKVNERGRRFMRYFTLTHLYNAGVSEDELQTYRNAFAKLINSLSWNTDLVVPEVIDDAKTIFAVDIRQLQWNKEIWQAIEDANPYFLELVGPEAVACREMCETPMPSVRVDWFVFAASKPPLYHTTLGLPESDRALEDLLRVNVQANIDQEQAIRAGFNRSGVSQNNRLIEWHKSPYGSYWKSYDFGGNIGRQNLFECPLGPASGNRYFQHDGGEIIFTLPNGLLGFLLVDEAGARIDQGPTHIVSDPKQPDRAVTNGVSCLSCHYAGIIPKRDEVGVAVRLNRTAFQEADDILALYRPSEELDRLMSSDSERFASALRRLGISNVSRSGEPVSAIAARFQDDIDLRSASAEFGLQPQEFLKRLAQSTRVARLFSSLTIEGGTLKRDVFKDVFQSACADLNLITSTTHSGELSRSTQSGPMAEIPAKTQPGTRASVRQPSVGSIVEVAKFDDQRWGVSALAFGQRNKFLVAGHPDRSLTIFNVEEQSIAGHLKSIEGLQQISQCLFTPDGSRLMVGGSTGQIMIYGVSHEGILSQLGQFAGHTSEVTSIAVSADGKFVLSGESSKQARFWELATGEEVARLDGFAGAVKAVHLARNNRVAMATDGEKLVEFDLSRKQVVRDRPLTRSWASGQAAAFSADGDTVAVGDSYNVRLWNIKSGRELPTIEGNEITWSLRFSPDGSLLLGGGNAKVNVWSVSKSQRLSVQNTSGTGYNQTLAISDDGKLFTGLGSSNRALYVYGFR